MKKIKKKKKKNNLVLPIMAFLFVIFGCTVLYFCYVFYNQNIVDNQSTQTEPPKTSVVVEEKKEVIPNYIPPLTEYKFNFQYDIKVNGNLKTLNFKMPVPLDEKYKQYVKISSISQKPHKFYKTQRGAIAEYNFTDVPAQTISIGFSGILKSKSYDLKTAKLVNLNFAPEADLSKYLIAEKYIESDDAYILSIANGINGSSREEIVDKIFRYVQGTLKYTVMPNIGAKKALEQKRGKCSEYAASMVALCRAKGIPARVVTGHFLRERDTSHAWVEVYYDEYGWVTYDPTILSATLVYKDTKGKVLKVVNNLKPDEAQSNYVVLSRNELSRSPINYTFSPEKQGSAQIMTHFTVEKM